MSRILITGGTGFVGNHLRQHLKGNNLLILSSQLKYNYNKLWYLDGLINLELRLYSSYNIDNLSDIISKFKPEYIYHLAADSSNQSCRGLGLLDNIRITQNLLQAIVKSNIAPPKFIYFSSGDIFNSEGIEEPRSEYAISKICGEYLCESFFTNFKLYNLTIVRPAAIVGANMTHGIIPDVIKKLQNPKLPYLTLLGNSPGTLRGYVHITDLLYILKNNIDHHTINKIMIGNNCISAKHIGQIAKEVLGINKTIKWSGQSWSNDRYQVRIPINFEVTNSASAVQTAIREQMSEGNKT